MRSRKFHVSLTSGWVAFGLAVAADVDIGHGRARAADVPWIARGASGMVAADSKYASQAGLEILQAGGNAIDAAVATSFALAVTRPYGTGPGGGGFMIARFADGRVIVQDFRETAPAAATPDMFAKAIAANPKGPSPSEFGHLAVAVPGLVAGRCQAMAQYGTMPLKRVLDPAIRLAKSGFPVDEDYVRNTKEALGTYEAHPSLKQSCGYVYRVHLLGGGHLRTAGQTLVQPELAQLLEEIASNGPDFFYKGPVAQAIARDMRAHGGIITEQDLADYQPRLREPLLSTYRDYKLILMPLSSSGGVALAETLNILEKLDFHAVAQRDPILAMHLQLEAMKHAFADRARWLGDQDFVHAPIGALMSKAYAAMLAKSIHPDHVGKTDDYGSTTLPDDSGTSHLCVADKFGNVVVSSETINTEFGSLVAIDEWGLILNNEMDDFTTEPGKPNAFGLVQSAQNAIAPKKRPLSSMCPTIVLKDDRPYLLLGASGGPRIISSVLNVLLGVTDAGVSLEDAIQRLRPHHQWSPDTVFFDREPPPEVAQGLVARGHKLTDKRKTAIVQAILRTPEGWIGASDPRKGGQPAAE
jgi:gamma-glutamyltranspeptidase/glutathione hydrolase